MVRLLTAAMIGPRGALALVSDTKRLFTAARSSNAVLNESMPLERLRVRMYSEHLVTSRRTHAAIALMARGWQTRRRR